MKKVALVGKISFVLGIILLAIGIFFFIQELKEGFTLKNPQSISFIFIGITIFLSAFLYKKENKEKMSPK